MLPWLIAFACLIGGTLWFSVEARAFRQVWDKLMAELKPERSVA